MGGATLAAGLARCRGEGQRPPPRLERAWRAMDAAASMLRHPGAGAEALAAARGWVESHSEAEDQSTSMGGPTDKLVDLAPLVEVSFVMVVTSFVMVVTCFVMVVMVATSFVMVATSFVMVATSFLTGFVTCFLTGFVMVATSFMMVVTCFVMVVMVATSFMMVATSFVMFATSLTTVVMVATSFLTSFVMVAMSFPTRFVMVATRFLTGFVMVATSFVTRVVMVATGFVMVVTSFVMVATSSMMVVTGFLLMTALRYLAVASYLGQFMVQQFELKVVYERELAEGMRVAVIEAFNTDAGRRVRVPVGLVGAVVHVASPADNVIIQWDEPMRLRGVGASPMPRAQWRMLKVVSKQSISS
ncbi:unnamed protein product [Prorocentrum cordatum]|uniref:Uncharacterized protein n=1 Tax=Prorocentrum cordatum TaxID=2364126 RepID=A0ABN9V737_9DINO|nr:unnamed protein product [Polarella glacialis]